MLSIRDRRTENGDAATPERASLEINATFLIEMTRGRNEGGFELK
jgi:hypothetical protein